VESTSQRLPAAGLWLLVLVSLAWGTNWPIMKIVLGEMPPLTFRATIVPACGVLVLLTARAVGQRILLPTPAWRPLLVSAFLNVTCWHALTAFAIREMDAGRAAILAYTMPLWVALMAWLFLGESMNARRRWALALGIAGIALLVYPDWERIVQAPGGTIYALAAAATWAAGTLWQKRVQWTAPLLTQTGWQLLTGGLPILAGALAFDSPAETAWSPALLLMLAYLALGPICLGYWAWYKVIAVFPTQVAAIGMMMVPAIGVLSGVAVLGEPLGPWEMAALILVTAAIALVLIEPKKS